MMMVVSVMMMMPPSHLLHHCLLCQDLSREHHLLLALHARVRLVVRYLVGKKETLLVVADNIIGSRTPNNIRLNKFCVF